MEDFYGEKISIDGNYRLVGLEEIVSTDEKTSILVTKDIQSCIVVLAIYENKASMVHIETMDKDSYAKGLELIRNMINEKDTKLQNINMFTGVNTPFDKIEEIKELLEISKAYESYQDCNHGSIAYNFKTKEYYGVDNDNDFYKYKLGYSNSKKDPLDDDEYWDNLKKETSDDPKSI